MSGHKTRPVPKFPMNGTTHTSYKSYLNGRVPGINSVLKAPPRSNPVPRIVTKEHLFQPPKAISFKEDSNSTFISDSMTYSENKPETYFDQCFTILETLGTGNFGEVYKVMNKDDKKTYACKRMHLRYRSNFDRDRCREEVKKLEQLPPHKNCVKFYRAWEEDHRLHFLTEACKFSLHERTRDRTDLTINDIWSYIIDILKGLKHLHENNLIHMDLKPENIFIGEDDLCKIGDFGLVIDISKGAPDEAVEGDSCYLAPECFQNVYSTAADMFSLGMLIIELATGLKLPNRGREWHDLRTGRLPLCTRMLPNDMKELLVRLIDPMPNKRLTAKEALALPSIRLRLLGKQFKSCSHSIIHLVLRFALPLLSIGLCIYVWFLFWLKSYTVEINYPLEENDELPQNMIPESPMSLGLSSGYHLPASSTPWDKRVDSPSAMASFSDDEDEYEPVKLNLNESLDSTPSYMVETPVSHERSTRFRDIYMGEPRFNGINSAPAKFLSQRYKFRDDFTRNRFLRENEKSFCKTSRNLLQTFSEMEDDRQ